MKVAFIVKGIIRHKRKFYSEFEKVKDAQICEELEVFETEKHQHAIELAENATKLGFTHIIAVGGDGTLNEVLNGIMVARRATGMAAPILGLLPYGTANDMCRGLGIKPDGDQLIALLKQNEPISIDIGHVDSIDKEGMPLSNYFINVADAGIGGYVVAKVNNSKKRLGANLTFLKAIAETFLTYQQTTVTLKVDDHVNWEGKILSLVVANGAFYGSGLNTDPDAKLTDGLFNIIVMSEISAKDFILNVGKLKKAKRLDHPRIKYFTGKEIEIVPKKYSCPAEMDGEYIGFAPLKIKLIPKELPLLCPAGRYV